MTTIKVVDESGHFTNFTGFSVKCFLSARFEEYWQRFYDFFKCQTALCRYYTPTHPSTYHITIKDLFSTYAKKYSVAERDWFEKAMLSIPGWLGIVRACNNFQNRYALPSHPKDVNTSTRQAGPFLPLIPIVAYNNETIGIKLNYPTHHVSEIEDLVRDIDSYLSIDELRDASPTIAETQMVLAYQHTTHLDQNDVPFLRNEINMIYRYLSQCQSIVQFDMPTLTYHRSANDFTVLA